MNARENQGVRAYGLQSLLLVRQVALLVAGYGCHLVMVSLLGWNGMLLFSPLGVNLGAALSATDISQAIAYPLVFLVVGALAWCLPVGIAPRRGLAITTLIACAAGASFLSLSFWPTHSIAVASIAGVLIGLATAGFFLLWQLVFSRLPLPQAAAVIMGGTAAAGLLFFLIATAHAGIISVTAFVTCLAVSAGCLNHAFRRMSAESGAAPMIIDAAPRWAWRELVRDLWSPALCIAALGFASGIAPIVFFSADTANAFNELKSLARLASALILWVLWRWLSRRNDRYALFYLMTFPVVATGFLLLPFFGLPYQLTFSVVAYLIFSVASMIMMLLCARESQVRHLNPLAIYGVFAGVVYLMNRAGKLFGSSQGYAVEFGFSQLLVVALLVIYVLSIILLSTRFKGMLRSREEKTAERTTAVADPIGVACARLAQRYDLTPREAEVLDYLARGRNTTFISEELVVSSNTVRAHCKNIYRKLAVHSRQELLDRVEQG